MLAAGEAWRWRSSCPSLVHCLRGCISIGELVSFDQDGRPSFDLLGRRMLMRDGRVPVCFLAFDVIAVDGAVTLGQPYDQRRRILDALDFAGPFWATVPSFDDAEALWSVVTAQRLEGVVAKCLPTRTYRATGRRWVKTKSLAWPRRELERETMAKARDRRRAVRA